MRAGGRRPLAWQGLCVEAGPQSPVPQLVYTLKMGARHPHSTPAQAKPHSRARGRPWPEPSHQVLTACNPRGSLLGPEEGLH